MSDIALPGSIEPASAGGPKLDHGVNPLTDFAGRDGAFRHALFHLLASVLGGRHKDKPRRCGAGVLHSQN